MSDQAAGDLPGDPDGSTDRTMKAFVARNSLWKHVLLLLPCVLIVFVAVFGPEAYGLRPKAGWEFVLWPAALFSGLVGALIARGLFDPEAQIVVGQRGIFMRHWSPNTIPWEAILRISIETQHLPNFAFKRHL
ncbi:MAG TPA: hypothetical protein VEC11_09690 [Allosphingosinicella sp.]|nr:hypothetical protein [Allosphingosinicella sp.]